MHTNLLQNKMVITKSSELKSSESKYEDLILHYVTLPHCEPQFTCVHLGEETSTGLLVPEVCGCS